MVMSGSGRTTNMVGNIGMFNMVVKNIPMFTLMARYIKVKIIFNCSRYVTPLFGGVRRDISWIFTKVSSPPKNLSLVSRLVVNGYDNF